MVVVRGVSPRTAVAASIIVFALWLTAGWRSAELDAPWKVDEGQRIGEGYFWRLVCARDFRNPDWFRDIGIRSHPPVSKYFYGAAVAAARVEPPRDLALTRAYDSGIGSTALPASLAPQYQPMLRPARHASFVLNALTLSLLFGVLLWMQGPYVAVTSQVLLFGHFLFAASLYYARSDTAQTLFAFSTIVALLFVEKRPIVASCAAGALAALSFQTRLNGGIALLMCAAFLLFSRRRALAALAIGATFAVVSIVISPYYWAEPSTAEGVPAQYVTHEILPSRVIHRFVWQVRDLHSLLAGEPPQWHLRSVLSRIAFTASVLFSGKAGIAIAGGLVLVIALISSMPAVEHAAAAWAATAIVVFACWVPLRWEQYVLLIVPPAVLAASIGYGAALRRLATRTPIRARDDG